MRLLLPPAAARRRLGRLFREVTAREGGGVGGGRGKENYVDKGAGGRGCSGGGAFTHFALHARMSAGWARMTSLEYSFRISCKWGRGGGEGGGG